MNTSHSLGTCIGTTVGFFLCSLGCDNGAAEREAANAKANSQVQRIVADLDRRRTDTGLYIRVEPGEIKEQDPWGTLVQVDYAQGGVAEVVSVRSAGPDGEFHTEDDVMAEKLSANMKGIGEGIKQNTEETAANAAKGIVKGTVEGVKESVKDSLPFRQKPADDPQPETAEDQNDGPSETVKPNE